MSKTITVKDVYDAIEKNGYPWGQGNYEYYGTYCAIGQAAKNLGVDPYDLHTALNEAVRPAYGYGFPAFLAGEIEDYNDNEAETYSDVVEFARNLLTPYFDVEINLYNG